MLRVAYLTHEYDLLNGSTLSLLNMIHSLRNDVIPLVIFPKNGKTVELFNSKGIRCEIVPFVTYHIKNDWKLLPRRIKYCIKDHITNITSRKRLKSLILKYKIDLVHTNTSVINIGYHVAKNIGIPHIWHVREFIDSDLGCTPLYGFKSLTRNLHDSDATISITKAIKSKFKLNDASNAYQLFNAIIDEPNDIFQEEKEKYFLVAGRLTPEKGIKEAIEAFNLFNINHSDYQLKLIGDITPEYKAVLQTKIRELNLENKIEFHKYCNNLCDFYRKATGFLMCSKMEGLGRVTIEAMNYGCPVIGYDSGGTAELINHDHNGLLFKSVKECAWMMNIVTEPRIRKRLIDNAISFSRENFTEKIYRKKILRIYNHVKNYE